MGDAVVIQQTIDPSVALCNISLELIREHNFVIG